MFLPGPCLNGATSINYQHVCLLRCVLLRDTDVSSATKPTRDVKESLELWRLQFSDGESRSTVKAPPSPAGGVLP
jgi:hypothetical protein